MILVIILLYFFLSIIALLIATYTDLKERMVYNKLTYTLIGAGLGLKIIESIKAESIEPLLFAIGAGAIAFGVSYLLWKLGVWAGGDVKLVTALAIVNPVNYAVLANAIQLTNWPFTTIELPIFSFSLILYSALAVFPLGILMSFTALRKHPEIIGKTFEIMKDKSKNLLGLGILIAGLKLSIEQLAVTEFLIFPALIIISALPRKIRYLFVISVGIVGLVLNYEIFIMDAAFVFFPLLIGYWFWKLYNETREYAFKETIKISDLEEGMISDVYMVQKKEKIELVEGPSIKRVIKNLMNNKIESSLEDFQIKGKIIGGPSQAGGFTEEDVAMLKEKAKKGLAPKEIKVRKTMAFVPAIFIAYIALQLTGDFLWNLILG
ncbi:MAG: A24 family peptidase [Candidatus Diapherotrites archaeon]